jgi:hypothetical protein
MDFVRHPSHVGPGNNLGLFDAAESESESESETEPGLRKKHRKDRR